MPPSLVSALQYAHFSFGSPSIHRHPLGSGTESRRAIVDSTLVSRYLLWNLSVRSFPRICRQCHPMMVLLDTPNILPISLKVFRCDRRSMTSLDVHGLGIGRFLKLP